MVCVIIVCLKIFSLDVNILKFVTRITLYWLHMVTINHFYIITTKLIVYIFFEKTNAYVYDYKTLLEFKGDV